MSRILGIDYGEKHVGVAISDILGILASGIVTLDNKNKEFIIGEIKKICKEKEISKIVIGLPTSMSGSEENQAKKVKKFTDDLKKEINVSIVFEDERLTSMMAGKFLDEKKTKIKERKEKEHKLSAQIILQDYLDKSV